MSTKVPSNLERTLMKIEQKISRKVIGAYYYDVPYGEWAGNCYDDVPYGEVGYNDDGSEYEDNRFYRPLPYSPYTNNKIAEAFRLLYK